MTETREGITSSEITYHITKITDPAIMVIQEAHSEDRTAIDINVAVNNNGFKQIQILR